MMFDIRRQAIEYLISERSTMPIVPAKAIAAATLPNGTIQCWAIDNTQQLWTSWTTENGWTAWSQFARGDFTAFTAFTATPINSGKAVQLFAIDGGGEIWTCWSGPNGWTNWTPFNQINPT
jgi:hypothetical protein